MIKRYLWGAFLAGSLLVTGCSGPLQMTVTGTSDMNSGGNAAVVRVYQLTNTTNFQQTPISSFWADDRNALGDELVSSHQLRLYPNQSERVELDIQEATRYVGVAADLRRPEADEWRVVYPVADLEGNDVIVMVGEHRLSVNLD